MFAAFFGGDFGLTLGIGGADHTRFSASSKGIAGVSASFFSGGVFAMASIELDEETEFYLATGEIVAKWAYVEFNVDAAVSIIIGLPGGHQLGPALPQGLIRKIEFLQLALKRLPILAAIKSQGIRALVSVLNVKDRRHDLVHSCRMALHPRNNTYQMLKLDVRNNHYHSVNWKFDLAKLPALRRKLEAAAIDATWLSSAVLALHKASSGP